MPVSANDCAVVIEDDAIAGCVSLIDVLSSIRGCQDRLGGEVRGGSAAVDALCNVYEGGCKTRRSRWSTGRNRSSCGPFS